MYSRPSDPPETTCAVPYNPLTRSQRARNRSGVPNTLSMVGIVNPAYPCERAAILVQVQSGDERLGERLSSSLSHEDDGPPG